MKKMFICIIFGTLAFSQNYNARQIIERVDENNVAKTIEYKAKLLISMGGRVQEKEFFGYVKDKALAYMEFTAPARDKGTRFLKISDEMWLYLLSIEKSTKIAGHMLRQSMMGSDFSYEDINENKKLADLYEIELVGTDTVSTRICFELVLIAKVDEISYHKRKVFVDTVNYIPLRVELYAKSGKLLKEVFITDFKKIAGKNFPTRIKMINKLRKDTYTEMVFYDLKIDHAIPSKYFTKSYLERK